MRSKFTTINLVQKAPITLLPLDPVYPPWSRESERSAILKAHTEKRTRQLRSMSVRRKVIKEIIRRINMQEMLKEPLLLGFEPNLLRYSHYDVHMLVLELMKQEDINSMDERKQELGRAIIEHSGYAHAEEKEDMAISLFPFFGRLYSPKEMSRLAECWMF